MKAPLVCSLILLVALAACKKEKEVDMQAGENWEQMQQAPRPPLPPAATWPEEQAQRTAALEQYIEDNEDAYAWFTQFPFGVNYGTPMIILKLMPVIAPEHWGSDENPFDIAGLFFDERLPGYPVPRGIGWTGMTREDPQGAVDHTAFSCSACHVGRVRLDDGSTQYLDGGVNTHLNLSAYRVAIQKTIEKLTHGATNDIDKVLKATHRINAALDSVHAADPNYFYNDYTFAGRRYDAAYETAQIERFKREADVLVGVFLLRNGINYQALEALIDQNYQGFESEMYRGFGGMVDATGTFSSWGYVLKDDAEKLLTLGLKDGGPPSQSLPPAPGITDFMVVWEQGKRKVSWNDDKTALVDGGGQWNNNIPIPMYRNMAAQLTLGLANDTDFRISALAVVLLEGLSAPVYPFDVDMELAAKGKPIYEANCASCHRAHNGEIYDMGTNMDRAHVVNEGIADGARSFFTRMLPETTTLTIPPAGIKIAPTAIYDGVWLDGDKEIVMRPVDEQRGYAALPLGGVWAQAPYLHNGSIPTIYHLLVPSERPAAFLKSSLDYDKNYLGFAWRLDRPKTDSAAYVYDTSAFRAFSNAGHDTNTETYRLDWSGDVDRDSVMAIIEYMKTL